MRVMPVITRGRIASGWKCFGLLRESDRREAFSGDEFGAVGMESLGDGAFINRSIILIANGIIAMMLVKRENAFVDNEAGFRREVGGREFLSSRSKVYESSMYRVLTRVMRPQSPVHQSKQSGCLTKKCPQ